MPYYACPKCAKSDLIPLAHCEYWEPEGIIEVTGLPICYVYFLTCNDCQEVAAQKLATPFEANDLITLDARWRSEFTSLNPHASFEVFVESRVKERHSLGSGCDVYVTTEHQGLQACILEKWLLD